MTSRRTALIALASTAAIAGIKDQRLSAQSAGAPAANPPATDWAAERARVMAVGLTADEAECWDRPVYRNYVDLTKRQHAGQ